jgi:serine/threonine protein kinase
MTTPNIDMRALMAIVPPRRETVTVRIMSSVDELNGVCERLSRKKLSVRGIAYKVGKKIGDFSVNGYVKELCTETCDDLVAKFVPFYGNIVESHARFDNEVKLSKLADEYGFGPKVETAFKCEYFGVIVMQRLYKTFGALLDDLDVDDETISQVKSDAFRLVNIMHNHGIYHLDLHSSNIMVDRALNPFIIDFGGRAILKSKRDASLEEQDAITFRRFIVSRYDEAPGRGRSARSPAI